MSLPMDWKILIAVTFASTLTWMIKSYLDSYLKGKGANLATKEDVEEITRKVEGVKTDFSLRLEAIKWELGKKATVHRLAAEKEFEALGEIGKALFEMKFVTMGLRPAMDTIDPNEPVMDRHNRRYNLWVKSFEAFREAIEKPKLFLPAHLYRQFMEILHVSKKEGLGFEISVRHGNPENPPGTLSFRDYEQAQKNVTELIDAIEAAFSAIRKRYGIDD
jgi:hypothetical protein